ncbi:conjugal transfer protein [Mergibacter septicus]|uniref:Conjugal transfer protein n=1 Tax=Mergibacter septicus TaxID=221402 RepID=A0A8D4IZ43_9PAST|nr:RAQPRD family integrative conjugative element protein [Mergibacter septicus]AWX14712.1 conjugal transfer protein [Mergibacter septicus]QDJ13963.1 conjugal transfer protein [Mergibacter septicus]UTU48587.1 conjugal transfer protein [Mergibacter septicus]WMR95784.1 RAQPRD family integrative conjugative element protein [Mergibacter septicus]
MKKFLLLSGCLLLYSPHLYASESAELAQAIAQLTAAEQSLIRAKEQNTDISTRFYFDYVKAMHEIQTVRHGIYRYLNNERAQPRDPNKLGTVSGLYEKRR